MNATIIGQFLAALRKSQGMTQQDVAERLNVTNKTISKWERGDGFPEITMIPALAELYDVTTDEILRGSRLTEDERASRREQKSPGKTDRQIMQLLNRSLLRFKNASIIATALILLGLIALFTIAYSAYRPDIAFGVLATLTLAAVMVEWLGINQALAAYRGNDLFDEEDARLLPYRRSVFLSAFAVFSSGLAALILALPFLFVRDGQIVKSVITFSAYLRYLPFLLALVAVLLYAAWKISVRLMKNGRKILLSNRSENQQLRLNQINRKMALIAAIVILFSMAGQIALSMTVARPQGTVMPEQEFEQFANDWDAYIKARQHAFENKYFIIDSERSRQVIETPGQNPKEVFVLDPEFEAVARIDRPNRTVYTSSDIARAGRVRNEIGQFFIWVYFIECLVLCLVTIFRHRALKPLNGSRSVR